MVSKYGFQSEQEREEEKRIKAAAESALRDKRKQVSSETVQRIGAVVRDCLAEYFSTLGLGAQDESGQAQAARFEEVDGIKGHTWKARSWKTTGTHSEYRADGVHALEEQTAYSITVMLVVNRDCLPLLRVGDFSRSRLVGGKPIPASDFRLDIPRELVTALEVRTGIKQAGVAEYLRAQDN